MPRSQRPCLACGKPLRVGSKSLPEPTCTECRRSAWPSCIACGKKITDRGGKHGRKRCHTCAAKAQAERPAASVPAGRSSSCIVCGAEFTTRHPTQKTCLDERCKRRVKAMARQRTRIRYKVRKRGVASEPYALAEIAARDRYRCGLCHRKVNMLRSFPDPRSPSIDHIVPLSKGGDDTRSNVRLAHHGCNLAKGNGCLPSGEQLLLVG